MGKSTPPVDPGFADLVAEDAAKAVATITATFNGAAVVDTDQAVWDSLTENAIEIDGHDLLKEKNLLVGVPFVITAVVVRDGVVRSEKVDGRKVDTPSNYVSLEVMVAPRMLLLDAVSRKRITTDQFNSLRPLEKLVINDGSTGICRQVIAILHHQGLLTVPDGPETGEVGESRYDTYRASWVACRMPLVDAGNAPLPSVRFDLTGVEAIGQAIKCPRGLRVSEYDGRGAESSTTFYLA